MGREVRMVPADWQHPKNAEGHYIPLYGRSFAKEDAEWKECALQWALGARLQTDYSTKPPTRKWIPIETAHHGLSYAEWAGKRPRFGDYMPDWPASERTHLMMYEDTTEGTPISPALATPEELARWLADNGASAFGGDTASYEGWLRVCKGGWAPSMVIQGGVMQSGVEAAL